jgi:hypothetical protein
MVAMVVQTSHRWLSLGSIAWLLTHILFPCISEERIYIKFTIKALIYTFLKSMRVFACAGYEINNHLRWQDPAVSFQTDSLRWFEHIQEPYEMAQKMIGHCPVQWCSGIVCGQWHLANIDSGMWLGNQQFCISEPPSTGSKWLLEV